MMVVVCRNRIYMVTLECGFEKLFKSLAKEEIGKLGNRE